MLGVTNNIENEQLQDIKNTNIRLKVDQDWLSEIYRVENSLYKTNNARKAMNEKALEILQKPKEEITLEDKMILKNYTGTGGLGEQGRESLTQYFTDYKIINMIWRKLEKLSFPLENIKALEPAVGIGNFIGLGPNNTQWDAIDIDATVVDIVKILYPSVNVKNKSFEEHRLNDAYDLVITNVPFLDTRGAGIVKDKPEIRKLHDYFVLASLDKVKANGMVVCVVPSSIMDQTDNTIRKMINDRAELVCAYRLPTEVFKKTGADVVTDILFLRKRVPNTEDFYKEFKNNLDFVEVGFPAEFSMASRQLPLNKYYMENKDHVLGRLYATKNRYGQHILSVMGNLYSSDIENILSQEEHYIPANCDENVTIDKRLEDIYDNCEGDATPIDGLYKKEGKWYRKIIKKAYGIVNIKGVPVKLTADNEYKIEKILEVADNSKNLRIAARIGNTDTVSELMKELKESVKCLRNEFPFLFLDSYLQQAMGNDPRYEIVKVLFKKPDIFKKDTLSVKKYKVPLNDHSDLDEVAKYLMLTDKEITPENFASVYKGGISLEEAKKILTTSSVFFKKPSIEEKLVYELGKPNVRLCRVKPTYERAVDYLYGNIYKKLEYAQMEIDDGNIEYNKNLEALKKVLPTPKTVNDICFSVKHKWIDLYVINDFVNEGLGYDARIEYDEHSRKYEVNFEFAYARKNHIQQKLKIGKIGLEEWFEKYLNGKSLVVLNSDGKKDPIETAKITKKMEIVDEFFQTFLKKNPQISEPMVEKFNFLFNNWKSKDYSKDKLIIPDVGEGWKFRDNQLEAADMALTLGSMVNSQRTGAGKTATNALVNHMLKVTGRAKKPMAVVPGKVIKKFVRDINRGTNKLPAVFPNMKILDTTEYNFHEALAMIAFNEWDLILIPDTWFKRISVTPARELRYIEEQLDNLMVSESRRAKDKGNKRSKRDFEKRVMQLEQRIAEIRNYIKCDGIYFEDLGVDSISLDEAQSVKNLVTSVRGSELGLSATPSQIAVDFNMKAQYIMEQNNGHNVFLYTATPVSNSILEIYGLLLNIAPYEWISRGIYTADDFIEFFADVSLTIGVTKENEVGPVSKIDGFINTDQLRSLFRQYVDYRPFIEDVKLPEVEDVRLSSNMSERQRMFFAQVLKRLQNLSSDNKEEDNVLKILVESRLCSVSEALFYGDTPTRDNSPKIQECIELVHRIYNEIGGNQIVFLDQYGKSTLGKEDLHYFIKNELITEGIPEKEIIIVNGSVNADRDKKLEIQEDFNRGKYRIIIGTSDSIGAGMDLQEDTIALHNLCIPWTPTQVEQRLGRAWRPGNRYNEILNINYFTRGSYDAWSASIVALKKKWQDQLLLEGVESVGGYVKNNAEMGWNVEQIMAEIMEDPVEKEQLNFKAEKKAIEAEIQSIKERIAKTTNELDDIIAEIEEREGKINSYQQDLKQMTRVKLARMRIKQLTETTEKNKKLLNDLGKEKENYASQLKKKQEELKRLEASYSQRIEDAENKPVKETVPVDIDLLISKIKEANKEIVKQPETVILVDTVNKKETVQEEIQTTTEDTDDDLVYKVVEVKHKSKAWNQITIDLTALF
jgi:N12 class adenine-specific DNA methylase